jgi:hypothetical protein
MPSKTEYDKALLSAHALYEGLYRYGRMSSEVASSCASGSTLMSFSQTLCFHWGSPSMRRVAGSCHQVYPYRRTSSPRSLKHFRQAHSNVLSLRIAKWPHLPPGESPVRKDCHWPKLNA